MGNNCDLQDARFDPLRERCPWLNIFTSANEEYRHLPRSRYAASARVNVREEENPPKQENHDTSIKNSTFLKSESNNINVSRSGSMSNSKNKVERNEVTKSCCEISGANNSDNSSLTNTGKGESFSSRSSGFKFRKTSKGHGYSSLFQQKSSNDNELPLELINEESYLGNQESSCFNSKNGTSKREHLPKPEEKTKENDEPTLFENKTTRDFTNLNLMPPPTNLYEEQSEVEIDMDSENVEENDYLKALKKSKKN